MSRQILALVDKWRRWAEGSDDNPQGCQLGNHSHDCPCGLYDECAEELEAAMREQAAEQQAALDKLLAERATKLLTEHRYQGVGSRYICGCDWNWPSGVDERVKKPGDDWQQWIEHVRAALAQPREDGISDD